MPADSEHSIKGTVEIPNLSEENDVMSDVDVSLYLHVHLLVLYSASEDVSLSCTQYAGHCIGAFKSYCSCSLL